MSEAHTPTPAAPAPTSAGLLTEKEQKMLLHFRQHIDRPDYAVARRQGFAKVLAVADKLVAACKQQGQQLARTTFLLAGMRLAAKGELTAEHIEASPVLSAAEKEDLHLIADRRAKQPLFSVVKTYQAWEDGPKMNLSDYLQAGDEVDEELYDNMGGVVSPQYCSRELLQLGEADYQRDGVYFYTTFHADANGRYFYLGVLPEFMQ